MGACARNMQSDSAEIKPAQCCIKLVFHLTYTMMHGSTKLKFCHLVSALFWSSHDLPLLIKLQSSSFTVHSNKTVQILMPFIFETVDDGRFQQTDNDFLYQFRDIGDTHKYSDQLWATLVWRQNDPLYGIIAHCQRKAVCRKFINLFCGQSSFLLQSHIPAGI